MNTTYLVIRDAFNTKTWQNVWRKSTFVQDSASLIREEQNPHREVVGTEQTYEKQQKYLLVETGRCCTWQKGALGLSRPTFMLQQWHRPLRVSLRPSCCGSHSMGLYSPGSRRNYPRGSESGTQSSFPERKSFLEAADLACRQQQKSRDPSPL